MPRFVRFEHFNPNVATAHNMMSSQLTMVTRAMNAEGVAQKSNQRMKEQLAAGEIAAFRTPHQHRDLPDSEDDRDRDE